MQPIRQPRRWRPAFGNWPCRRGVSRPARLLASTARPSITAGWASSRVIWILCLYSPSSDVPTSTRGSCRAGSRTPTRARTRSSARRWIVRRSSPASLKAWGPAIAPPSRTRSTVSRTRIHTRSTWSPKGSRHTRSTPTASPPACLSTRSWPSCTPWSAWNRRTSCAPATPSSTTTSILAA